jgi:hypothetical protein
MAFTPLTFPFGSKLTSTQLNQIQGNFTALAERQDGAPEMRGICKRFVTFYSSGQAQIIFSQGVTSVTFTGDPTHATYTINWTNSFQSANYCTNFAAVSNTGLINRNFNLMGGPNKSSTAMDVYARLSDENNTQGINPQQITVVAWEQS